MNWRSRLLVSKRDHNLLPEEVAMGDQGPRGAPEKQDLEPAYNELMGKLYLAFKQYSDEGDAGRKGVSAACWAVVQFIAVRHENPELAIPFLAIRQALTDFDNHVDPDLLSRTGAKERSRSGVKAHLRRWASVCLEVLIEGCDQILMLY
jgi:hypothetical protein